MAESMGRVSEADKASWFVLCQRWQRIRELEACIDEHGPLVKGRQGEMKRNPAAASLAAELKFFAKERDVFGLSPESRELLGFRYARAGKRPVMESLID